MTLNLLDSRITQALSPKVFGVINSAQSSYIKIKGVKNIASIGDQFVIKRFNDTFLSKSSDDKSTILSEVVKLEEESALLMPYDFLNGIKVGDKAVWYSSTPTIYPSSKWLGRIIDGLARPVDNKGSLPQGRKGYFVQNKPIAAEIRKGMGQKVDLGVKAINIFTSCCLGQRMGIFAGSGIGKSTLLAMMAEQGDFDVIVIGLIGERGREFHEFINETLSERSRAKSVIIKATSDESALMRRQAAHMTMAVSEYFRDEGLNVLCLLDSVTRFAMAEREIGLATGEPPTVKGYTPSVFANLSRLLERAGPGTSGTITGIFTVLVDGDDHNEPISDAVRGILDGHIVLDRAIAEKGRYPAINITRSISRTMPKCNTKDEQDLVNYARILINTYSDMEELIKIGAYKQGTNPLIDDAIKYNDDLERFLSQSIDEKITLEESYNILRKILYES